MRALFICFHSEWSMMATSVYQRGTNGRLSMLEKSLERRRVNKEHNSNFRAGHVPVHEEHLHKTGLRGRKRYFAYCFLALLYITAIANLTVTALVMWVLQIDHSGLHSLQFLRGGLVRFLDDADIDSINARNGQIGSFMGEDLHITGQDSSILIAASGSDKSASVEVSSGETIMKGQHGLEVISPKSGATIFHTKKKEFILPTEMDALQTSLATTSKIVSDTEEELVVSSDEGVELIASEELSLSAKRASFKAKDLLLSSVSGIVLDGHTGTFMNTSLLPKATNGITNRPTGDVFKLCVCKSTGKIFRVRMQLNIQRQCANLSNSLNVCA